MRNIIFFILVFVPCALGAFSDFKIRHINPRWDDMYIYADDTDYFLYDCETHSIIYRFHMWLPWEMTHSPWCYCHGTEYEISDRVNAEDFEWKRLY